MEHSYDTLYAYASFGSHDVNDSLTADDLGITEEQYADAIEESADAGAEGVITVNGHQVYAA